MADNGFTIRDVLDEMRVQLNIPEYMCLLRKPGLKVCVSDGVIDIPDFNVMRHDRIERFTWWRVCISERDVDTNI